MTLNTEKLHEQVANRDLYHLNHIVLDDFSSW